MKLSYRNERNAKAIADFWDKPLEGFKCWKIENQTDNEEELLIYDIIGWPFNDASEIVNYLRSISKKDIKVKINSPGGDVFDGMAIYSAMVDHEGLITTQIDSLAASISSVISLGGKKRVAHKNAMYMIHEPWTIALGNQYEFNEIANLLGKISNNLIDIYAENSSIGKREVKEMMKSETWFTAKEMKEKGFIDDIIEKDGSKAKFDLSIFNNVPEWAKDNIQLTIRDAEKALRDKGFSQKDAKALLSGRSTEGQRDVEKLNEINDLIKSIQI